jgi:glycosyltransferase involved in cell wall biosynthesis
MKKLLCVIYSIHGGGAEKQMRYLLRQLDRHTFEIHAAVFSAKNDAIVLPPDVHVYNLDSRGYPASVMLLIKLVRLIITIKPHVILSFLWGTNLIALIAALVTRVPVVISERTYTIADIGNYSLRFIRKRLISLLYPGAKEIIAVSYAIKNSLVTDFHITRKPIRVIYNGIDIEEINRLSIQYAVSEIHDYIISCGSLNRIKNQALIIQSMAGAVTLPLVLLGAGPDQKYLAALARRCNVKTLFPGFKDNPYPWIKHAQMLILSSLFEGLPNVVLEAMALEVPVIAVDCPGGIRELITHKQTGLLIPPSRDAIIDAINQLQTDRLLKELIVRNSRELIRHFDVSTMVRHYDYLLASI